MNSGIYMYKNKVNKKVYIGQSKNITRRQYEHKHRSLDKCSFEYDSLIHKAFRKYGIENFSFYIVENCNVKDLNKKEIYYIKKYNSVTPNGYNITLGGYYAAPQKLSYDLLAKIDNELLKTKKTNIQIANEYNVSENLISSINTGRVWKRNDIVYPIRKNSNQQKEKHCQLCGVTISNNIKNTHCISCSLKVRHGNISRPGSYELAKLIIKEGFEATGRRFNVSGNAIKRWCRDYKIPYLKNDLELWYDNVTK